jgi:hypothetical protein
MKRSWRLVAIDVAFALALGFGIWLSALDRPRYLETKASR